MRHLASLLLWLPAGCASTPQLVPADEPGFAPFPYTAEAIRDFHPDGTAIVFRLEPEDAAPYLQTMEFSECDAEGTTVTTTSTTLEGAPVVSPAANRSTWTELQAHAKYPLQTTTIAEEEVAVPAGRYACWRYTMTNDQATTRAWFAKEKPGPPVQLEVDPVGAAAGSMRMVLVQFIRP